MKASRLVVAATLGMALLVGLTGCPKPKPPETPGKPVGPDSAWQRGPVRFEVTTTAPGDRQIRYVMDWGDGTIDTTATGYASGTKAYVYHAWQTTGTFSVKALAVLDEDLTKSSDWSEPASIKILPNSPPNPPEIHAPLVAVINVPAWFSATTTDPEGDSVGFQFEWGDGKTGAWSDTVIGFVPGGATVQDSHTYKKLDTVLVRCRARDWHKAPSDWSQPETVVVGEAGGVIWWWWTDDEEQWLATTSPAVVMDGADEIIYTTAEDGRIYGLSTAGKRKRSGYTVQPQEENEFSGHPAYCATRQHVICGNSDGELYAFTLNLVKAWHWPGHVHEDSLDYLEWGTAAINGDKIYVPYETDSLYYFTDLGSTGRRDAAYYIFGMVDAPVVDASGYVYIGTDSGYLYKMPPNLASPTWKKMLRANDDIHGPVIGADGTIYCGSTSGRVFAVDPATGSVKWTAVLDGETYRVVVSPTALFVVTGFGKLYCLNPANGSTVWFKQYSSTEIITSPILGGDADGYVYFQDYDDIVYCLRQSDGQLLWSCDCAAYGPAKRGRRGKPDFFEGQPAILSNGNLVVVGQDALYCVAAYNDRPLMAAPWPKWQRDAYNTGKAGAW